MRVQHMGATWSNVEQCGANRVRLEDGNIDVILMLTVDDHKVLL